MIDILLIAVIVVIVVDISGFIDELKSGIKRLMTNGKMSDPNYSLKPIDCSFCLQFWISLIYINKDITLLMLAYILLVATLTPVIRDLILFCRELMIYIIRKIQDETIFKR